MALSSKRYNVLYLDPVSVISGAERSLQLLLRSLNRERFRPLVVLPALGPMEESLTREGIETLTTPLHQLKAKNPLPYLKSVYRLTWLIRSKEIDLVHCNMDICNQYALPAARVNGIPVICHTRNILSKRAFQRMFLAFADVLIANSKAVAKSYVEYTGKSQTLRMVYNGVDLKKYSLPASGNHFRKKFGLKDDAFIIGHIARICPEKGQHVLIQAMNQVTKNGSDIYALIVGDTTIDNSTSYLNELRDLVLRCGLKDRVIFTGFLGEIESLYAALDLVVLPSTEEPFGRTLIEAMAMNKPVIATRSGGAVEIVDDGVTGLLVPPDDPDALSEAVLHVHRDKELAGWLGNNGRDRVENMFSAERHVQAVEDIYREVLGC